MSIREAIEEVSAWAAETTFSTTEYTSGATGKTTALIKDWKDLVTSVSDLQSLLGSLKDSRFFAAFEDTIAQYESKLAMLDHVRHVSTLSTCQHCPRVTDARPRVTGARATQPDPTQVGVPRAHLLPWRDAARAGKSYRQATFLNNLAGS